VWATRIISAAALAAGGWLAGTRLSDNGSSNDLTTDTIEPAASVPVLPTTVAASTPASGLPPVVVPATEPPLTAPPGSQPPTTLPTTLPPATAPPTTVPPTTLPPTTTTPPAPDTTTCTNDEIGFSIEYPVTWYTTDGGDPLLSCTWFDPRPFDIPADSEIDVAISAYFVDIDLDQMVEWELDPAFAYVIDYRETTIDGRRAVVAEVEYGGDGYYPNGWHGYFYLVDWDGRTFELMTVGMPTTTFPGHVAVLDEMATTLRLGVPPT
jgi:hypothetical protein